MSTVTPNYGLILPGVNDPTDQDLWGGYLNTDLTTIDTTMKAISDVADEALAQGGVPIGAILDWAGSAAPTDYLLCYGQAISRATYSDLFTAIGTVYGTGDGSTTFNLPDLRGRVAAGKDDMGGSSANRLTNSPTGGVDGDVLGGTGGSQGHTLITAEIPPHTHDFGLGSDGAGSIADRGTSESATGTTDATGGGGAHNNVQPTIILNKIIRAL